MSVHVPALEKLLWKIQFENNKQQILHRSHHQSLGERCYFLKMYIYPLPLKLYCVSVKTKLMIQSKYNLHWDFGMCPDFHISHKVLTKFINCDLKETRESIGKQIINITNNRH